jgi:4-amino-4-deoxy-L-arabinose transferase-like glycosyltransferase
LQIIANMGKNKYQQLSAAGMVVLMIICLTFKLLFIEHPLESDDTKYMSLANELSVNNFSNPNSQLYLRTGILIPLFGIMSVFGYSIFTYYFFSIGFSILLLFSLMLLARELFGLKIALITGLIYSSSSLIGYQSTNLLPDTPAFFWAVLSVYFFVRFVSDSSSKHLLFLAAISGFIAYLCKEPVLVFYVTIPLYEYYKRKSIKRTVYFIALLILFWAAESFIYWILTGDIMFRKNIVSKGISKWMVNQQETSIVDFLFTSPINILNTISGKILFISGALGGVLAFFRKNNKIIILLAGGLVLFSVYTYSFYSLDPLIPSLPPQIRYITGFFCMLAIVSAWTIFTLYRELKKWIPAGYVRVGLGVIMLTVFGLQSVENLANKNTVLFYKDTYFVANRKLKEIFPHSLRDTVYTLPKDAFQMFSNFRELKLERLGKKPGGPCYILYSTDCVKKRLFYAQRANNDSLVNLYQNLLVHKKSKTIFEYDGIVLSHADSWNP